MKKISFILCVSMVVVSYMMGAGVLSIGLGSGILLILSWFFSGSLDELSGEE